MKKNSITFVIMNKITFILIIVISLISSCAQETKKPEDILKQFIELSNQRKNINDLTVSKEIAIDYKKTRRYAELLNSKSVKCVTKENIANCNCKTESGKTRNFVLVKNDDEWKIDLNQAEIVLEIFHLYYINAKLKEALAYANSNEKTRLKGFIEMAENLDLGNTELAIIPFKIKCKNYKKKSECSCTSANEEASYWLFKTEKGWKAEMFNMIDLTVSDSIIDYNSSEDFNLNQHDLDSLTDFSRQMLDSMLNL